MNPKLQDRLNELRVEVLEVRSKRNKDDDTTHDLDVAIANINKAIEQIKASHEELVSERDSEAEVRVDGVIKKLKQGAHLNESIIDISEILGSITMNVEPSKPWPRKG